jgi:hypothetical protein
MQEITYMDTSGFFDGIFMTFELLPIACGGYSYKATIGERVYMCHHNKNVNAMHKKIIADGVALPDLIKYTCISADGRRVACSFKTYMDS